MTKSRIRELVYAKYDGRCAYCGRLISMKEMQIDHIVARYRGGDDYVENYNPACRMCNFRKGALTIDGFREEIIKQRERLQKEFAYRMSVAYGLIAPTNIERIVFYFEKQKAQYVGKEYADEFEIVEI